MTLETPLRRLGTSLTLRLFALSFLCLLLLAPLASVRGLVRERQALRAQAAASIASGWGARQLVLGPVLVLQAECETRHDRRSITKSRRLAVRLPEKLTITGDARSELRHRGIHVVPVYRSVLRFELEVAAPALAELNWGCDATRIDAASIVLALSDLRGIDRIEPLVLGDLRADWVGGTPLSGEWARGVQAAIPIGRLDPLTGPLALAFELELRGSERIAFVPAASSTEVTLAGDWATPSFDGAFLPAERELRPDGFRSVWRVSGLARPVAALHLDGGAPELAPCAFGVTWFRAADAYLQAERSLKYGFLFIALTFLTFFLFELGGERRAQLVQYGLVGAAICVFFLLLLAISEHAPFWVAYAAAATATAAQVTLYGRALLASSRRLAVLGGVMATLYGCLYVLIGLEEVALLVGSAALFLVIGVTMWMTRSLPRAGAATEAAGVTPSDA